VDDEVAVGFADRLRAWLRGDDAAAGGADRRVGGEPTSRGFRTGTSSGGATGPSGAARRSRRGRGEHPAGGFDGTAMLAFARSRSGVEAYVEPRTNLYGDSVLLVADDGEYLRRPIPDAQTLRRFCAEHGIPVYDAARTGYPRRVRDYDRGVRPRRIGLEDLPPWPDSPADPATASGAAGAGGTTGADVDAADGDDEDGPPPPPPTA